VIASVPLATLPQDLAFDSAKGEVFVTDGNNVSVISDVTNAVTGTIHVGMSPEDLAYDGGMGEVFVANSGSDNVSVISDGTNTVAATFPVGSNPEGITYDNATSEIFVANSWSNNVSVLLDADNSLVGTVPVGILPASGAFDYSNGYTYVVNWASGSVSVLSPFGTGPALASVAVTPANASIEVKASQAFTGTPTCTGGGCPSTTAFSWTLSNPSMGTLSVTTGNQTTFTAGNTAGTVSLFVNASLNGNVTHSSAVLTITPAFSSVLVSPSSSSVPTLGTANFTASPVCTGGPCVAETNYSWTITSSLGGLNNSFGPSVTFTAGGRGGTIGLFVNASQNGETFQSLPAIISILPTLLFVSVAPSSATLTVGAEENFSATPACTGGACPAGSTFSWSLASKIGTLSADSGTTVMFIAGTSIGSDTLFVNATLDGITMGSAPVSIRIIPALISVIVNPASENLSTGEAVTFTASPVCSQAPCPSGTAYSWSLTNSLGKLSSKTSPSVTFTAGNNGGTVTLFVNVTLNGKVAMASAHITISAPSTSTLLGLPGILGYIVVAIVAVAAVVTIVLVIRRNKKHSKETEKPKEEKTAETKESEDEDLKESDVAAKLDTPETKAE